MVTLYFLAYEVLFKFTLCQIPSVGPISSKPIQQTRGGSWSWSIALACALHIWPTPIRNYLDKLRHLNFAILSSNIGRVKYCLLWRSLQDAQQYEIIWIRHLNFAILSNIGPIDGAWNTVYCGSRYKTHSTSCSDAVSGVILNRHQKEKVAFYQNLNGEHFRQ